MGTRYSLFLMKFINKASDNLDESYHYDINYILNIDSFLDQLKPSQKKEVIFAALKTHYMNFYQFFNCDEVGFKSKDMFVKDFLLSLNCQTFLSDSPIISREEICEHLYLIESGKVIVSDRNKGTDIVVLKEHCFFGDYQIFLDARSNVSYRSHKSSKVICYTIEKSRFIDLCNEYQGHTQFFMERSLCTRRLYKRLMIINMSKTLKLNKPTEDFIPPKLSTQFSHQKSFAIDRLETFKSHFIYKQFFEGQGINDFKICFLNEAKEEELDYLSDNEIAHRSNEDNIFILIRKANRLEK